MINFSQPEIQFTLQAVRQASLLVSQIQSELVSPALTKNDRSPVTVADFASQALVGELLSRAFPDDPLVAEEDSSALQTPEEASTLKQVVHFLVGAGLRPAPTHPQADAEAVCRWIDHARPPAGASAPRRFWTLDPIDGTKGFLRGDQYAVALALVEDGQVQIGALGCPELSDGYRPDLSGPGSLVIAQRGRGAWAASLADGSSAAQFHPLHVSGCQDPAAARLLRSFESGHTNADQIGDFSRLLGVQVDPVRMDSQAKYGVLAAGHGDLLLRLLSPSKPNYREKIWDQAAGSIILQEAGGQITDLSGKALDFTTGRELANNRGILASNGLLHQEALKALRSIGAA
jgi:3'(2'), 5'-bisphosphate nucleotidase